MVKQNNNRMGAEAPSVMLTSWSMQELQGLFLPPSVPWRFGIRPGCARVTVLLLLFALPLLHRSIPVSCTLLCSKYQGGMCLLHVKACGGLWIKACVACESV